MVGVRGILSSSLTKSQLVQHTPQISKPSTLGAHHISHHANRCVFADGVQTSAPVVEQARQVVTY